MNRQKAEQLIAKYKTPKAEILSPGTPFSCTRPRSTVCDATPISILKPRNNENDSGISASFNSNTSTMSTTKCRVAPRRLRSTSSTQTDDNFANDENCLPPSGNRNEIAMLSLKQEYESLLKEKEDEINSNKEKYDKLLKEKDEKLKGKDDQLKYLNSHVQKLQQEFSFGHSGSSVPPDLLREDYVIINNKRYLAQKKHIGAGASSRVFKGVDCATNRNIALKIISLKFLQPSSKEELEKEVQILRKLKDQPNIINLFDYEYKTEKGRLSLVLEYGEVDLNIYLRTTPCLIQSPTELSYHHTFTLWHQMLCAVGVLHDHHIIHKDLKPQNFLMVQGKLKLIDFGISVGVSDEQTSMIIAQPEGTPNYIAPEVLGGTFGDAMSNVISYRSDIFSLGCILFKMCFGVAPYQHIERMHAKYVAISSPNPVKIPETLKFPDLREILVSCLQKNRLMRPTIKELQDKKHVSADVIKDFNG